ncbi:MAG: hypothetical protein P4K78_00165 [Terracidiphilus sp.]|nr:hypothetical protein [Terracidiphilus sp.]
MENPDDANAVGHDPIKHYVLFNLISAQSWLNRIASAAHEWVLRQEIQASLQFCQIDIGLKVSPGFSAVLGD